MAKYEVLSLISSDSKHGLQPGDVIDEADFTPQQIAAYVAAGAITPSRRKPTVADIDKAELPTPVIEANPVAPSVVEKPATKAKK